LRILDRVVPSLLVVIVPKRSAIESFRRLFN
jgi:hypothetical protein